MPTSANCFSIKWSSQMTGGLRFWLQNFSCLRARSRPLAGFIPASSNTHPVEGIEQVGANGLAQDEASSAAACRDGFGENLEAAQKNVQAADVGLHVVFGSRTWGQELQFSITTP